MNKIVLTKNSSAIFLAIVLVTGTFAVISPSFITGANAQAQPYYRMDNYQKSYGKDDRDKSKDNTIINKINCINPNNINVNGNFNGNITTFAASQGLATADGYLGAGSFSSGYSDERHYDGYNNKGFECIINNNNNNTNLVAGSRDNATDGNATNLLQCPDDTLLEDAIVTDLALCNLVTEQNKECQVCVPFSITPFQEETAGLINNAINDFSGGLGGICTSDDPITTYGTVISGIDELGPVTHDLIIDSFSDCVNAAGVTSQAIAGSQLSANNSPLQTSNIQSGDLAASFSSPPTIAQETGDSSALEKIAKLKTQWLDLLP